MRILLTGLLIWLSACDVATDLQARARGQIHQEELVEAVRALMQAAVDQDTAVLNEMSVDPAAYERMLTAATVRPGYLDSARSTLEDRHIAVYGDTAFLIFSVPMNSCGEYGPPEDELQFILERRGNEWVFRQAGFGIC